MHCNGQGFTILSLFEGLYLGCDPPFNRGKPHSISRSRKVWIPWKVVNLCRSHIVQAEDELNTSLFRFPSSWSFTCTRIGMIRPQTKKKQATQHPPSISLVSLRLVWSSFEPTIRFGQSFSLSFWLMVGDKSQPFRCFLFPPRSLSSSLRKFSELLKRCRGFLGSLAPRLRQEDEDEET